MIELQSISSFALAVVVAGCFATPTCAEAPPANIADEISTALFKDSGDIYRNRGIDRQATFLFGLSYPEHEFINDAHAVEKLYRQGMQAQSGGKVMYSADLPNPFTSSIRTTPAQTKSLSSVEPKGNDTALTPAPTEMVAEEPVAAPSPRGRW